MPDFVVRDVRLFDGVDVADQIDVWVSDGSIRDVGRALEAPRDTPEVDGEGHTLLPGLIDCHTHTWSAGQLRGALAFGVTVELDMLGSPRMAAGLRAEQVKDRAPGRADLFSAGFAATAPDGHGTQYGIGAPTLTEPEEAEGFVRARTEEGSDYIKIILEGHRDFRLLPLETAAAVVDAAHAAGTLAVVHVSRYEHARYIIEAGADGLAHLFTDRAPEPDFGEVVRSRGAFVVPTLTVLETVCGRPGGPELLADEDVHPYVGREDRARLEATFPTPWSRPGGYLAAEEAIRQLRDAGAPILAGTDASNPGTAHGASLHRELQLLVTAGLEPLDALRGATSLAARCFRLEGRGRVLPGRRADLVLVEGDPTTEIRSTRRIAAVWKAGVRFDREAYRAEVVEGVA